MSLRTAATRCNFAVRATGIPINRAKPYLVGNSSKRTFFSFTIEKIPTTGNYSLDFGTGATVGNTLLAFITSGYAWTKNRSDVNWFVLTLFGGPFATLALFLSDDLEEPCEDTIGDKILKKMGLGSKSKDEEDGSVDEQKAAIATES